MEQTTIDRETLKQALKEALAETLHEEREFLGRRICRSARRLHA